MNANVQKTFVIPSPRRLLASFSPHVKDGEDGLYRPGGRRNELPGMSKVSLKITPPGKAFAGG